MKLTTDKLKQIIQEELEGVLKESPSEYKSGPEDYMDASVEDIRDMVSDFEAEFDMDFEKRLAWVEYKTWKATLWSYSFVHTREGYFKHIKPIEMAWIHAVRRMGHAREMVNSHTGQLRAVHKEYMPPILHPENVNYLWVLGNVLVGYYKEAGIDSETYEDGYDWSAKRYWDGSPQTRWRTRYWDKPPYPFEEAKTAVVKYLNLYFPDGRGNWKEIAKARFDN